jgi:hypothetical protein
VSMRFPSGPARLCALFPALLAFASVLASGRAEARTAYGLNFADQIITFDTFAPGSPSAIVAISGLQAGETPLAIDLRPSTGQIYLLVTGSRLYVVNPVTGAATAVGAAFTPALSGSSFGFDFEPTFDTLRVVSDTGQNLRLNPDTGAVVAVDPVLTPGAAHIVGSAYSNNYAGATSTTLYAIDSTTDQVFVQDAFTGVLTLVGPMGVNTSDAVGFDISAHDGTGFATLTVAGTTRLYLVGLTGGPASDIGAVANGPYRDLTILARGVPMVALRGNELIRFHSATPGSSSASTCARPTAGCTASVVRVGCIRSIRSRASRRKSGRRSPRRSRARASGSTSTRPPTACASSATPSRTCGSTRTTVPSLGTIRR